MNGRIQTVLLFCLPAFAQQPRVPTFPPDVIAHDSPIRDIARIDTKHVRVDLDNSRMRVLRISLGVGEALPTHDSREGVLLCFTACSLAMTNPVGYVREVKLEAGQTLWIQAERHKIANAGGAVEMVYIEVKRAAD